MRPHSSICRSNLQPTIHPAQANGKFGMNSADFLDCHLQTVISWIEAMGEVNLIAVGIGFDVRRYYRRAVNIADASELAASLIDQLSALYATPSP